MLLAMGHHHVRGHCFKKVLPAFIFGVILRFGGCV